MVGAFWWVLVFRLPPFCVCFLLDSLRLTSSLVVPFLGDCDNPVARACRGKKRGVSSSLVRNLLYPEDALLRVLHVIWTLYKEHLLFVEFGFSVCCFFGA